MRDWLNRLDKLIPLRYGLWLLCVAGLMLSSCTWLALGRGGARVLLFGLLSGLGLGDRLQTRRSVLRNHPVAGHIRYLLEPGALLAAVRGEADWPHNVYRHYLPLASAHSFAPRHSVELPVQAGTENSAWGLPDTPEQVV